MRDCIFQCSLAELGRIGKCSPAELGRIGKCSHAELGRIGKCSPAELGRIGNTVPHSKTQVIGQDQPLLVPATSPGKISRGAQFHFFWLRGCTSSLSPAPLGAQTHFFRLRFSTFSEICQKKGSVAAIFTPPYLIYSNLLRIDSLGF